MDTDKKARISHYICAHLCLIVAFFLLAVFVGGGCQHAAGPTVSSISTQPTYGQRLSGAKDLFYRAVAGDRDALDQSEALLRELGGAESADAEVVAYTGATELLAASRAFFPWDKASLAHQGLALQDRAVVMAPQDLEVRFLRGVTNYQLPIFLGRHQLAIDDLAAVARVAEQAANEGRLDRRAAVTDLDTYANELRRQKRLVEAIAAWQAAARIGPDIPAGADALSHLSAIKELPTTLPNSSSAGSNPAR
jgi:hypothetical protein